MKTWSLALCWEVRTDALTVARFWAKPQSSSELPVGRVVVAKGSFTMKKRGNTTVSPRTRVNDATPNDVGR